MKTFMVGGVRIHQIVENVDRTEGGRFDKHKEVLTMLSGIH